MGAASLPNRVSGMRPSIVGARLTKVIGGLHIPLKSRRAPRSQAHTDCRIGSGTSVQPIGAEGRTVGA